MADLLVTPPRGRARAKVETALRINYQDLKAADKIAGALMILISSLGGRSPGRQRTVICIGSDRSTGDSLGPLVGSYLERFSLPRTSIRGTLANPVHALNLEKHRVELSDNPARPLVIAVDASLGKPGSVGLIEVGRGPLMPGAGVNKHLPPVGQIYLSGIVNIGGFMEQMVLQSTRLHHVLEIARVMAEGLQQALTRG